MTWILKVTLLTSSHFREPLHYLLELVLDRTGISKEHKGVSGCQLSMISKFFNVEELFDNSDVS